MPRTTLQPNSGRGWARQPQLHVLLVCLCLWLAGPLSAAAEQPTRVLLLNSWAQTEAWPSAISRGVQARLKESGKPYELFIENSDFPRFQGSDYPALADFMAAKYASRPPDFLLASDEQSTDFLFRYGKKLFPRATLVFVSLRDVDAERLRALGNAYQVLDTPDFTSNLPLIRQLLPDYTTVAFVGTTTTEQAQVLLDRTIEQARQSFPVVEDLTRLPLEDVEARLAALPADSAVVASVWARDRQGRQVPPIEMVRRVTAAAPLPVFGNFDQMLELGVVGGKMVSGEGRGRALAESLLQLLDGATDTDALRQRQNPQPLMFDYRSLRRLGLEGLSLPAGSMLLNRPKPWYETHPLAFFAGISVVGVLVLLIAFLLVNLGLRHRTAVLLAASERRYRLLFEDNPSPMLVYEQESLQVLSVNQAFERDFGFTAAEMKGRAITSIAVPEQREELLDIARDVAEKQIGLVRRRWIAESKDGQRHTVEASGQSIEFGSHKARVVLFRDISERLAVEAALRVSELRLNQIIESSPLPTMVLDAEQRVTHWNFALELFSRIPAVSMIGKRHNLGMALGNNSRPILVEALLQGLTLEQMNSFPDIQVKASNLLPGGLEADSYRAEVGRWFHSIAVPLRGADGSLLGAIQSSIDMTELRSAKAQLERLNAELEQRVEQRSHELSQANQELQRAMQQLVQSEKLAALGGLVAGVAHELNTPIGNAMTVVTTLQDHLQGFRAEVAANQLRRSQISAFIEACREACQMLERNTHRAADLVASFKQVAVDQTSVRRRQFRLADALGETLRTVAPLYKHQPVEVRLDVPDSLQLDSYPGPLEQVITNLLGNAVLHARGDHPQLLIRISAEACVLASGPGVRLSVRDDGIGMPADIARKVFDPFFTTRLGEGGSGLGLYVVFNLVSGVLGGRIDLQTAPGQGSCFLLELPLCAPEGAH